MNNAPRSADGDLDIAFPTISDILAHPNYRTARNQTRLAHIWRCCIIITARLPTTIIMINECESVTRRPITPSFLGPIPLNPNILRLQTADKRNWTKNQKKTWHTQLNKPNWTKIDRHFKFVGFYHKIKLQWPDDTRNVSWHDFQCPAVRSMPASLTHLVGDKRKTDRLVW